MLSAVLYLRAWETYNGHLPFFWVEIDTWNNLSLNCTQFLKLTAFPVLLLELMKTDGTACMQRWQRNGFNPAATHRSSAGSVEQTESYRGSVCRGRRLHVHFCILILINARYRGHIHLFAAQNNRFLDDFTFNLRHRRVDCLKAHQRFWTNQDEETFESSFLWSINNNIWCLSIKGCCFFSHLFLKASSTN